MSTTTHAFPALTGVLIQDPEDKGYTAFLAELPEIIAELIGDTPLVAKVYARVRNQSLKLKVKDRLR